jgi:hypothetical protein
VASSVEGGEGGGQRKQGQRKQSSRAKASVSMMGPLPLRRRVGVLLFLALVLLGGGGGADAGTTSSYRRKLEATVEMPLDADVFRVPPGYNAPQQVPDSLPAAVAPGHSRRMPLFSPFFFLSNRWMDGWMGWACAGAHHAGRPGGHGHDRVVGDGQRAGQQHRRVRRGPGEDGAPRRRRPHALRLLQLHLRLHPPLHPQKPQGSLVCLFVHSHSSISCVFY